MNYAFGSIGVGAVHVFSLVLWLGAIYLVKSLSSQWGLYGEATEIKKKKSDKHLFTNIKVRVEANYKELKGLPLGSG